MYQEIHKKSLHESLREYQVKIDSLLKRLLILSSLISLILIIICVLISFETYFLAIFPLAFYSLYTCFQFYNLWKTKRKIQKKLTEK